MNNNVQRYSRLILLESLIVGILIQNRDFLAFASVMIQRHEPKSNSFYLLNVTTNTLDISFVFTDLQIFVFLDFSQMHEDSQFKFNSNENPSFRMTLYVTMHNLLKINCRI